MARLARVVAPGYPHHITQRGNRRQCVFFNSADYMAYLNLLGNWCSQCGVEIWGYCLMPNHVHLIAVPPDKDGLRAAIAEVHRRYTRMVNAREGWKGYLWQGRFSSYVMDGNYLLAAARYIEMNPVRAGLCVRPEEYPWSSARAHLLGLKDRVARFDSIDAIAGDWREFMARSPSVDEEERLRAHSTSGRPLGGEGFVRGLETSLGRRLSKMKPGPRPQDN